MTEKPIQLLILEDEEAHQKIYQRTFGNQEQPYQLTILPSLKTALQHFKENQPDLIILDLMLEDQNGEELIVHELVKEKYPIIVMTSHGSETSVVRALKSGALDYMVKSVENFKELPHLVERSLREWGHIEERRKAEEALRESEQLWKTVSENSSDYICIIDLEGKIEYVNKHYLGLSPQEIKGKNFFNLIPSPEQEIVRCCLQRVLDNGKAGNYTINYTDQTGEEVYLEGRMGPLLQDGKISGCTISISDVTQRIQQEKRLAENEKRFRTVADFTIGLEYWLGNKGQLHYISPSCEIITGYLQENFYKDPSLLEQIILEEDLPIYHHHHNSELDNKQSCKLEYRIRKANHDIRWLEHNCQPVYDDLGQISGRRVSCRDITERKEAEEMLRESEERYRLLSETSSEGIIFSVDGIITDANKQYAEMLGYDMEEMIGRSMLNFTLSEDRFILKQRITENLEVDNMEVRGLCKDGSIIYVLGTVRMMMIKGQKTRVTLMRDITERKIFQQHLESMQMRFAAFMDNLPAAAFYSNAEGCFDYLNPLCEKANGFEPEQWRGKTFEDLYDPQTAQVYRDNEREVVQSGTPQIKRDQVVQGDQETWWENYIFPFKDSHGNDFVGGIGIDITRQIKAETELKESEERYRLLAETSSEGIIFSVDEIIQDVNHQAAGILGYKPEELIGKELLSFTSPPYQENMVRDHKKGLTVDEGKNRLLHKDGSEVIIAGSAKMMTIKGQKTRVTIFRDITQNRKTERELRTSEMRFEAFMENIPATVFYKDANSRYQYANPYCEEVNGFEPGEWKDKTYFDLFPHKKAALYRQNDQKTLESGSVQVHKDLMKKDGQDIWWENILFSFKDARGNDFFGGVGIDISERIEAEKAREESEKRFRLLSEQTSEGIVFIEEGIIMDANQQFADIFGTDLSEMIGKDALEFVDPQNQKITQHRIRNEIEYSALEYDVVRKDGKEIQISVSARILDNEGRKVRVANIRDITELKRKEKELQTMQMRFTAFIDNMPAFISIKDQEGKLVYLNNSFIKEGVLKEEDWKNKTNYDFFPKERADRYQAEDEQVLQSGEPLVSVQENIIDENLIIQENHKFTFQDAEENAYIGMISIDVTERVQAERELNDTRMRLEAFLENTPGKVSIKDANGKLIYLNKEMLNFGKISPDEWEGKTNYDFLEKEIADKMKAEDKQILRSGEPLTGIQEFHIEGKISFEEKFKFRFEDGQKNFYIGMISIDVTERIEAEQELNDAKTQFEAFIENTPSFVSIKDEQGNFVYMNSKLQKAGYLKNKNIQELTDYDIYSEENAESFRQEDQQVLQSGQGFFKRQEVRHEDTTWHLENIKFPYQDSHGRKFIGLISTDISERVKAERELQSTQMRFEAFLKNMPAMVTIKDEQDNYIYMSSDLKELSQLKEAEWQHLKDEDIFPPEIANKFRRENQQVLQSGKTLIIQDDFYYKGHEHQLESVKFRFQDADGQVYVGIISSDISERLKAERELKSTQLRLIAFMENTPGLVSIKDMQGNFVYLNQNYQQYLNLKEDEWPHLNDYDQFSEEMADTLRKQDQELVKTGEPIVIKMKSEHAKLLIHESFKFSFRDAEGHPFIGLISIDITDRAKAEQELKNSQIRFEAFADNIPASVILKDSQGNYIFTNKRFQNDLGLSAAELLGKHDSDFFEMDLLKKYQTEDHEIIKTGEDFIKESSFKVKGLEIFRERHKFRFEDAEGNYYIGLISMNINERMLARRELQNTKMRLEAFVDNIPGNVIFKDAEERIIFVNERFAEQFDLSRQEIENKTDFDIYDPELAEEFHQDNLNILESGEPMIKIQKSALKGVEKTREVHLFRFIDSQNDRFIGLISLDVTEREKARRELQNSRMLFEAFIENIPGNVIYKDKRGKYIYTNSRFEFDLRRPKSRILGKTDFDLFPFEIAEEFRRKEKIVMANDRPIVEISPTPISDYEEFREKHMFRFEDADGSPHFGMISLDVTDREAARQAINSSETRHRELFNNSKSAISIFETHDNGEVFLFNDFNLAAEKLNNFNRSEVIGKDIAKIFPDLVKCGFIEHIRQVWESDQPQHILRESEHPVYGKGWRDNYIYKLPTGEVVTIYDDVTEKILADKREVEQHIELEHRNQILTHLNKITTRVESVLDYEDILQTIHEEFSDLGIEHFITSYDPETEQIKIESWMTGTAILEQTARELRIKFNKIGLSKQDFPMIDAFIEDPQPIFRRSKIPSILEILRPQLSENATRKLEELLLDDEQEELGTYYLPFFMDDEVSAIVGLRSEILQESDSPIFSDFANQISLSISKTHLLQKVRESRQRMQTLSNRLIEVQEEERKFLAQELHDEVGQTLTGLKLTLQAQKANIPPLSLSLIDELSQKVENLSLDLRPSILDDLGLLPALQWQIDRFTQTSGVKVDFNHEGLRDKRMLPEVEICIYRIIQESLTNIARHAEGKPAVINLKIDEDKVFFEIIDQGPGFDIEKVQATKRSGGLFGMRERAEILYGTLNIESKPGEGTHITVELPLEEQFERREKERLS